MATRGHRSAAPRTVVLLALFCFSISVANPYGRNGLLVTQEEEEENPCESPEFQDLVQKTLRREPLTLEEHSRYLELKRLCREVSPSESGKESPEQEAMFPGAEAEESEKGLTSLEATVLILGGLILAAGIVFFIAIATSDWTIGGNWSQ